MANTTTEGEGGYNIIQDEGLEGYEGLIRSYALTDWSVGNLWNRLQAYAVESGATCKADFDEWVRPYEESILIKREKAGENVRFTNGKFKYTKVLDKSTYSSHKAVIGKALDAGVDLKDRFGKWLTKPEIEAAYKKPTVKSTAYTQVREMLTKVRGLEKEITNPTERAVIVGDLKLVEADYK